MILPPGIDLDLADVPLLKRLGPAQTNGAALRIEASSSPHDPSLPGPRLVNPTSQSLRGPEGQ